MNSRNHRGFTLWELLVTVLVMGVILGFGLPNLLEFNRNNQMAATTNELIGALMAARTEAVKRQVFVTLCASPNPVAANPTCSMTGAGTNGGFIVWVDENGNTNPLTGAPVLTDASDGDAVVDGGELVLLQRDDPVDIAVFGDSGYISYGANGFRRDVPGGVNSARMVLFCDFRGNVISAGGLSAARAVRIDQTGRAQVLRDVTDITNAVFPFGLACP